MKLARFAAPVLVSAGFAACGGDGVSPSGGVPPAAAVPPPPLAGPRGLE